MPAVKKPQDHKPKAVTPGVFTFEHDGATYEIPHPSVALETIPGKAFRDAMLGGNEGEIRFGLICLEAVGATQETLDALYAKPTGEMLGVIAEWMRSVDLSGATLPE